jgi:eukaryotic-like serine/threonine-protein kinase
MSPISKTLKGRYHILASLDKGGCGHTYIAEDLKTKTRQKCVVKHLNPDKENLPHLARLKELFEREADILQQLSVYCPQIPRFIDYFEEDGELYLVQEWIDGIVLHQELASGKKFTQTETIELLLDILTPLKFCHEEQLIHRDLKPANIMRRSTGQIIIIDFGMVKDQEKSTGNSLSYGGTPGYAAMEQVRGKPCLASDVYAVGIIAIEAITGIKPEQFQYDEGTLEIDWRQYCRVTEPFADILSRMVRQIPNRRYQNAQEALAALAALPNLPKPIVHPPQTPPQQQPAPKQPIILNPNPISSLPTQQITPPPAPVPNIFQRFFGVEPAAKPTVNPPQPARTPDPHQTYDFETVTLDKNGKIVKKSPGTAKYLSIDLGNGILLDMVYVKPGRFMMGSEECDDEKPSHLVSVPGFYMGKYAVTQEQYLAIMDKNPAYFKGAKLPVEQVSWDDAQAFCGKLKQKTRREFRLPSEAEWEYACRADTTTPFAFGETITPDLVNYDGDHVYANAPKGVNRAKITPVGIFPPNGFGLYDMHGTVWEWCLDTWHENYQDAPLNGSAWTDTNKNNCREMILRGGSWYDRPWNSRSACRNGWSAARGGILFGFRVVFPQDS